MNSYKSMMRENLQQAFQRPAADLAASMAARVENDGSLSFEAFGEPCRVTRQDITLGGREPEDPRDLLISLYALHAPNEAPSIHPLRAFKDLPGSMPYQQAFRTHTEMILLPFVSAIQKRQMEITARFDGEACTGTGGDFAFLLRPLPKILLGYIFYLQDEDFPASATCLFSSNATAFMPLDGLADVAEYTSRGILGLVRAGTL